MSGDGTCADAAIDKILLVLLAAAVDLRINCTREHDKSSPPYFSPAGIWPVPIACTNPSNENVSVIHNSIGQNNHTGEDLICHYRAFPLLLVALLVDPLPANIAKILTLSRVRISDYLCDRYCVA
jgi:hypothetical protein